MKMSPQDLIHALQIRGVTLHLSEGQLEAEGPDRVIKAFLPVLRQHKSALVEMLAERELPNSTCGQCEHFRTSRINPRGFGVCKLANNGPWCHPRLAILPSEIAGKYFSPGKNRNPIKTQL